MVRLLAFGIALAALDGGAVAPTPFEGTLPTEAGAVLVLETQAEELWAAFVPPRLRLPHHHAGRVVWTNRDRFPLPQGKVRLVFTVESHRVERMTERRWNSEWTCRILELAPATPPPRR